MSKGGSNRIDQHHNIRQETPLTYFQQSLAPIRQQLLEGKELDGCRDCRVMEQHGKVSGRQKQLLKVGIMTPYFEKSLYSSPFRKDFNYSWNNQGQTTRSVIDWQIDLGNYCNGACVFCSPVSSSKLATEFYQLGLVDQIPPPAWCDDPQLLDQFIVDLMDVTEFRFLHFIGGETLITPAFKKILEALVNAGLASTTVIGFTTNLSTWRDDIVNLLVQFQQVHLNMSVETLTLVNDYVRWPVRHDQTKKILDQYLELGRNQNWYLTLRTTPTALTIHDLTSVYDYAWNNKIVVESCNFLHNPSFLRINVLPKNQRDIARQRLVAWLSDHDLEQSEQIVNTRNPDTAHQQIYQDVQSYVNYLDTAEDESEKLPELVSFLKTLESNRKNSIIKTIPEYEELFRSAGY
jgi:MoaA/NifB/PqqE/SkfB family radical SAM enzyme